MKINKKRFTVRENIIATVYLFGFKKNLSLRKIFKNYVKIYFGIDSVFA